MGKITVSELRLLAALSQLAYCNPFFTERIDLEQQALGKEFTADDSIAWSRNLNFDANDRPNVVRVAAIASDLVNRIREQSAAGQTFSAEVLGQYWDVVTYVLLYRHIAHHKPDELLQPTQTSKTWKAFSDDYRQLASLPALKAVETQTAGHLFACLCQVHRAFYNIFEFILGDSLPTVRLRGAVLQSVFTSDLRRYRRSLYSRMGEIPSLITGPSGTGKELVARAIGLSQYIPFDENRGRFVEASQTSFFPLNLSAMSATLIESELFGHRKGSFTGAIADRQGWLEQCRPHGAVFLDEIGELDPSLQVKLLRVVQQRTYSRIGESEERQFAGKIIGATNRDMDLEMQTGRFREDLYYRLCADRIQTPGLREQLDHRPEDLRSLSLYISRRLAGDDAESLCEQSVDWILKNLGPDYPWRGNIRELEQCISSIMIRNDYVLTTSAKGSESAKNPPWIREALDGNLTADQLLQAYTTHIYHRTGSYESAARILKIDRRTVKAKIDQSVLNDIKEE